MAEPETCKDEESMGVNHVAPYEVPLSPKKMFHFVLTTHTKEVLKPAQVNQMFEPDFSETKTENYPLTNEDRSFTCKVS